MKHQQFRRLLGILAVVAFALNASMVHAASSWSPTLLVNTESFQTIDVGDGTTNIELRFGSTGNNRLFYDVNNSRFHFTDDALVGGVLTVTGSAVIGSTAAPSETLEVIGTASGRTVHAQDQLQSSGSLVVEGAATFGSTINVNGVTYTFPFGDGSTSGKVLKTDGAGNLSWSSDIDTTGSTLPGQGITSPAAGFLALSATHSGTTIEATSLLSGALVHAQNNLTSSGGLSIAGPGRVGGTFTTIDDVTIGGGNLNFSETTTIGDGGDQLTIDSNGTLVINDGTIDLSNQTVDITLNNAADALNFDSNTLSIDAANNRVGINTAAPDTRFEVVGTSSGTIFHAQDTLSSSGSLSVEGQVTYGSLTNCANLKTDNAGVLSCNTTDYIEESELDDMSELESQIGGSNIITSGEIDSESEFESVTGLSFFTGEEVEDQVASLLLAGTGIYLEYNDTANTLTVHTGFSSGSQVSLSPEYAGATYYGDGANNVGQMSLQYDATNKENYYKWSSSVATLQDYNIAIRVRVPDDFDHWDGVAPIQFRYRTNAAGTSDNQIDVTMLDTAAAAVSLTGGADLANTSWTTATITGPNSSGTYTPGSYITIILAMQARSTSTGEAHAGFLNINWHTEP